MENFRVTLERERCALINPLRDVARPLFIPPRVQKNPCVRMENMGEWIREKKKKNEFMRYARKNRTFWLRRKFTIIPLVLYSHTLLIHCIYIFVYRKYMSLYISAFLISQNFTARGRKARISYIILTPIWTYIHIYLIQRHKDMSISG